MKLVYDATPLLMRSAGVKNYHYSLLSHLIPRIWPHEIKLFPSLGLELPENRNERSNYSALGTFLRLGGVLASNYSGIPLANTAVRGADIFHATPHLFRPPSGPLLTAIVHDVTPLTMPEYHTVSNIRYFETFANKTLPKLAKMITPSVAVKSELVDEFGAHEARIEVIPHGVDLDYFSASTAQKQVAASEYDLPDEFVLFVGSIEPRKNLISLIHAHGRLPEGLQRRFPLLVVGAPGWKNSEVRAAIDRSRHARVVGYVKRELLPAVYDSASLFVLPSLYEGFGLPLLEAMAAGAPAIASNVSALPEVAGECAWLVNPLDIDELAEAMRAVLEDRKGAMELAARARQRARQFTWERCALETKDFFASVAGESL